MLRRLEQSSNGVMARTRNVAGAMIFGAAPMALASILIEVMKSLILVRAAHGQLNFRRGLMDVFCNFEMTKLC